jgi:hypothetical protein
MFPSSARPSCCWLRVLAENVIPCHLSDLVDFHDSSQGRDIGRVS